MLNPRRPTNAWIPTQKMTIKMQKVLKLKYLIMTAKFQKVNRKTLKVPTILEVSSHLKRVKIISRIWRSINLVKLIKAKMMILMMNKTHNNLINSLHQTKTFKS